jgi:hypothetical protein
MNEAPADPLRLAPAAPNSGLTRGKFWLLITLVLAGQLGGIVIFQAKTPVIPRVPTDGPHLRLADTANELVALNDPTLFARPHPNDFATAFWQRIPTVTPPTFRWTEPPGELPRPAVAELGATFRQFMQTNRLAAPKLNFKLPPKLSEVTMAFDNGLPQVTTLQISGDLATRPRLNQIALPSWPLNDVLPPSQVQVLVAETGNVVSAILLPDNLEAAAHDDDADQQALQLARQLRFAPASRPMLGQLIFNWHTVPTNPP